MTGQLRANTVVVSGEAQGNIDATAKVELLETGVITGDVKATFGRGGVADARSGRFRLEGQGPRRQVSRFAATMINTRAAPSIAGRTRSCPHCKATILESSAIYPQCRLSPEVRRYAAPGEATKSFSALRVEGAIRHPEHGGEASSRWCSPSSTSAARKCHGRS